jgi:hypothetical protein
MGGHLLAPIQLASTLHHLHITLYRSVLGGMASTMVPARSMSVLPQHHGWGTSPTIMRGSSIQPPPMTLATTIMATVALLRIMVGTHLPNCLRRCMGGIMLLLGMYPCLCMVVGPFSRAMGCIPVRLHWLPRAWRLRARCLTLLCRRRITVPPLDLTLPCHFPALVETYLLLSCTIPMPPGSFHLPPRPVLLPPHLLLRRCSSSISSRTRRLTWMLWGSLSSTFGTQIFHPTFQTACWLLPRPTLRPAAFGRVNFVWWSKVASFIFCSKIKATITMAADLRCWPPLMLTAIPTLLLTHSLPSFHSLTSEFQGDDKPILALCSCFMALFWKWLAVRW